MNRAQVLLLLPAYADGELAGETRRAIESYLAVHPQAQAEVQRWQALRNCARRGLDAEPVPAGLPGRVRANLQRRAAAQGWAWRAAALVATAAALLLVAQLLPRLWHDTGRAPVVLASDFARIYHRCSVERHHDPFQLAGQSPPQAEAFIRQRPEVGFAARVPELSHQGLNLCSVCACRAIEGLPTVHACYEVATPHADHQNHPADVVSVFSLARRVELRGGPEGVRADSVHHAGRDYAVAVLANGDTLLKWDDRDRSLAICSRRSSAELLSLADDLLAAEAGPAGWRQGRGLHRLAWLGVAGAVGLTGFAGLASARPARRAGGALRPPYGRNRRPRAATRPACSPR